LGILTKIFGASEEDSDGDELVSADATPAAEAATSAAEMPREEEVLRPSAVRISTEGAAVDGTSPSSERRTPLRPPPLPSPEQYALPSDASADDEATAPARPWLPAPPERAIPAPGTAAPGTAAPGTAAPGIAKASPSSATGSRRPLPPPPSGKGPVPRNPGATVVSAASLTADELRADEGARGKVPTMVGLGLSRSVARALSAKDDDALANVASVEERASTPTSADAAGSVLPTAEPIEATPRVAHAAASEIEWDDPEPPEQARVTMPTETSKAAKQTLIEEGTEFKGTLKSSYSVVVNGSVDGEIDAPEVTITRTGTVAGTIKAKRLRSQGTLSGNVDAADVFLSGSVRSNTVIKAKSLEVKLGSDHAQVEVTFGECQLELNEPATESDTPARFTAADTAEGGNGGSASWKKRLDATGA
jgi:cytoskeletal protein CcmA (bactofilin family)